MSQWLMLMTKWNWCCFGYRLAINPLQQGISEMLLLPCEDDVFTCAKSVLRAASTSLLSSSMIRKSTNLMKQVNRRRTPLHWEIWWKEGVPSLSLPKIQKGKFPNMVYLMPKSQKMNHCVSTHYFHQEEILPSV